MGETRTEDKGQRTKAMTLDGWTLAKPASVGCPLSSVLLAFVLCPLSFVSFAAPTDLSPATTAANPVQLFSDEQYDYLYNMTQSERSSVLKNRKMETVVFCSGSPLTLSWKGSSGTCTVTVKRLDGSEFWTGTTSGTSVSVVNLEVGAGYTWTVRDSSGSASATFHTRPEPPRLIKAGTMQMMRDQGGWIGLEGRRIRQGLIFRGGPADNGTPDDAARDFFYNVIGLKNEIDLRGSGEWTSTSTKGYMFDPTEKIVTFNHLEITYNKLYTKSDMAKDTKAQNFKKVFQLLFDPTKLPAYFHCRVGRDRTGTVAGLVLAVLGVSEDDIVRDYQASAYKGEDYYASSMMNGGFKNYLASIKSYKDSKLSIAENAKAYFIGELDFTDEQVETFRTEMLIGYGEPPKPTYWTEEPKYVTATRTKLAAGKVVEEQYTGFETKKGFWYTWGRDDEEPTGWTTADGTPLELAKPAGAGWKLMVKEGSWE